jgi:uncharacterized iron-regulated membrane protein
MKRTLAVLHRWLGIALAAIWVFQAITGIILVFHWELDDWTIREQSAPLDVQAFDARLRHIEQDQANTTVHSVWVSGGSTNRYDVFLDQPGNGPSVIRIGGNGDILRVQNTQDTFANGGVFKTLFKAHKSLLAGEAGEWFIAISGLVLLTSLVTGLTISWPRVGRWKRDLLPSLHGQPLQLLRSWHKALGLWLVVPAILVVITGVELIFQKGIARSLGVGPIEPAPHTAARAINISPGQAIDIALATFPDASFSGLVMPNSEKFYYTARMLEPGEWRRAIGKSVVLISPVDGQVIARQRATEASMTTRLLDSSYPLHTGEALGTGGRVFSLVLGAWLIGMCILGFLAWRRRRQSRRRRHPR